jgi:hypothetical protein
LGPGESLFLWDNDTLDWVIGKMLWRVECEEKVALVVGIGGISLLRSKRRLVMGPLGWVEVFAGAIRGVW